MEKVELFINDKPIFVPDEMTLGIYQKYMTNSELYEKDTILFMSLLSGIPVNDLKNCSTDEIEILDFFLKTRIKIPEKQELILTFDYDGVSYGLENDWSKLAWGAWVDFEVYSAGDIYQNLHKIMAILYRPVIKKGTFNVKKYKIVPYKSEEIEDRAEIMKNVPVSYWLGAAQFFFFNRVNVHKKYGGFFEYAEQDEREDNDEMEQTPKIPAKEATARFYFNLTYQLAKEDITKFEEVENMNLFICLNVASIMKEKYLKELEQHRKMEQKYQMNRR